MRGMNGREVRDEGDEWGEVWDEGDEWERGVGGGMNGGEVWEEG